MLAPRFSAKPMMSVVAAATIAVSLLVPATARADDTWGSGNCQSGAQTGCTATAGRQQSAAKRGSSGEPSVCSYESVTLTAAIAAALHRPAGAGSWYTRVCRDRTTGATVKLGDVTWLAAAPPPRTVAVEARSQLVLPKIVIRVNPSGAQVVGLPTWLSIGGGWAPLAATATAPGVTVRLTARPVRAVWTLGDGARVVCTGPGSVWTPAMDPRAASPTCGHTYRRSSAAQPGGAYRVSVQVEWAVTWAGAGQTGAVPNVATTAVVAVRVGEVQSVVTGS